MSNRLPILAATIKQAHSESLAAATTAVAKALEAGHALAEAKELVPHGGWLSFLDDAGIHERTAQRYMTLAQSDMKSDTVSDLGGITPALRFLRLRAAGVEKLKEAAAFVAVGDFDALAATEEPVMAILNEILSLFPPEQVDAARAARAGGAA